MVHNHTLNYIRDHLGNTHEISADDLTIRAKILDIESTANILDDIISQQIETELKQAIEELSPQCREIFQLARYQQLNYSEIAAKLDISVSTVKSQMLRAIEKLKSLMELHLK
jgi:RNA polymerase sigma-70 factor (ECF subfamily)